MADDRRDPLTSGDPLGGDPAPPPPTRPAATAGPERPAAGYAPGAAPPGAFAAPAPPRQRPVINPGTLASWGSRAAATIIDSIIVGALAFVLMAIFGVGFASSDSDAAIGALIVGAIIAVVFYAIIALLYAPLLMSRMNGQTLGKKAMGIRVVRTSGEPTDFWWSALREVVIKGLVLGFAGSVTAGIAYLVDYLWPIPDGQNRALHDFVVDSRVVKA